MRIRGAVLGSLSVVNDRQALASPFAAAISSYNPFPNPPWNDPNLIKAPSAQDSYAHYSGTITAGLDVLTPWILVDFGHPIWVETASLVSLGAQDAAQNVGQSVGFCWAFYRGLASPTETSISGGSDNNGFGRTYDFTVKAWLRYLRLDFGQHLSASNGGYSVNGFLDYMPVRGSR